MNKTTETGTARVKAGGVPPALRDPSESFRAAIMEAGLTPPDEVRSGGEIHRLMGLESVRSTLEQRRIPPEKVGHGTLAEVLSEQDEDWAEEPEEVLRGKTSSAPFPLESLPEIIREAVTETLAYTQVPVSIACSTALGVAAALVQHLVLVARDPQTTCPVSLLILSVLRSGERKSMIFRKMWQGFRQLQSEFNDEWKHYQANWHEDPDPALENQSVNDLTG